MHSVPLIYRLLLLAVLPCIAAVLYFRGQHYDAALIDFKAMQAGSSVAAPAKEPDPVRETSIEADTPASAPSGIPGFLFDGERRYTKENLYEHVNGHAEYFISAGFQELIVTEYSSSQAKPGIPDIRAERYDMGKGIQAFGVLADESGEGAVPIAVGAMGYKTSGGIGFIKGRYYVKLEALDKKAPLPAFAKAYAATIRADGDPFTAAFAKFPSLGKVEGTKFIKEGYRGLDFLKNVVEREYSVNGKKITVALLGGTAAEMQSARTKLMQYFTQSRIPTEKLAGDAETYKVSDKYEGNWFLLTSGGSLFGVFGTDDPEVLRSFGK